MAIVAPRAASCQGFSFLRSANAVLTSAAKMLAAAGAAAAVGERESWRTMDHVRYLFVLAASVNVWLLRILMGLFASSTAAPSYYNVGYGSPESDIFGIAGVHAAAASSALLPLTAADGSWACCPESAAIGRALSHILVILSQTPVTSRKYEFVQGMADRILSDNLQSGQLALADLSRASLTSAFSRTCDLLRGSLEKSSAATSDAGAWPTRVLQLLPMGPQLASGYNAIRHNFGVLFAGADESRLLRRQQQRLTAGSSGPGEWLEAEKLAHELLWITTKMLTCSAAGEAIVRWGHAASLASLSLTAHPRVQGPVVKISVLLLRELERGGAGEEMAVEAAVGRDAKFRMLAVWLPVLCYASNGMACPVLTAAERQDVERVLEELIASLPWEDQELILASWVEDFVFSDSDWPNLQRSFDCWCNYTRKLLC